MTNEAKVRKYNPYGQYEILRARIADLEKENAGLKKNIERYSQKIAEQEETIDAQDDKINFYVAKMNENILKRQELEKVNAEFKQKLESDELALNEANEIIAELKYNLKCRDDELAESKAENKQIIERERVVPEHYLLEMIDKNKELEEQVESLTKENNVLIKGLGCETCSISGEYLKLNNTIRKFEEQVEKMRCCGNCKYGRIYFTNEIIVDCLANKVNPNNKCENCDKWELAE